MKKIKYKSSVDDGEFVGFFIEISYGHELYKLFYDDLKIIEPSIIDFSNKFKINYSVRYVRDTCMGNYVYFEKYFRSFIDTITNNFEVEVDKYNEEFIIKTRNSDGVLIPTETNTYPHYNSMIINKFRYVLYQKILN